MKCKCTKLLLSRFLEHQLAPKRRNRLEKHLQECIICQQELDKMLDTVRIIQTVKDVDPPRDYRDVIKALFHDNVEAGAGCARRTSKECAGNEYK